MHIITYYKLDDNNLFNSYIYKLSLKEFNKYFICRNDFLIYDHIKILLNLEDINNDIFILLKFKFFNVLDNKKEYKPILRSNGKSLFICDNVCNIKFNWNILFMVCIHKKFYNLLKRKNYNVKDITIIDKNNMDMKDIINFFNWNIDRKNKFMKLFITNIQQEHIKIEFPFFKETLQMAKQTRIHLQLAQEKSDLEKINLFKENNKLLYLSKLKEFGIIEIDNNNWEWIK